MPGCADILTVLLDGNMPLDPGGIVVFGVAFAYFFWLIYRFTSKVNKITDGFFQALAHRDLAQVYGQLAGSASWEIRRRLGEFLSTDAFAEYKKARWISQSFTVGAGNMEGFIIMKSGLKIPLRLGMVWEKDAWKICSLEKLPPDYDPTDTV